MDWTEMRRQKLWTMWLEGSGEGLALCAELQWTGKREGSADERNGRGDSWV